MTTQTLVWLKGDRNPLTFDGKFDIEYGKDKPSMLVRIASGKREDGTTIMYKTSIPMDSVLYYEQVSTDK